VDGTIERTGLITGAGRGIGKAIAEAFAKEGFRLLLVSRSEECLETARALPQAAGFRADISKAADVRGLFVHARAVLGHLDVLVNNAGIAEAAPVVETSDALWERALATNLTGTFFCCRAALEWMQPRKSGHVINILSVAAIKPFPNNAAYCASKFGALGLTRVLREEARASGIRVTAMLPGAVDTPIWDRYWPDAPREKMMSPEEVGAAVLAAVTTPAMEEIVLRPRSGNL
jgi:NAD(P)-dependent dehydrogenase (short-subunit alcohol dehydrogenase family)